MHTTTNAQGQKVYRLAKISDLAGLPEEELEKALEMLPVWVHGLRLAGFAAGMPEEQIPDMVEDVIEWIADGKQSASYRCRDDGEVFNISINPSTGSAK
jgi:hypothetical protein